MQSILFILVSTFLLFFLNFFFKKKNFLIYNKNLSHKSFTSKDEVPITGGFLIFYQQKYILLIFCLKINYSQFFLPLFVY